MPRQNQTKPDTTSAIVEVSQPQELALMALVAGHTVTEAASAAGVARQTVSLWVNHDPVFIAAYNAARQQLYAEHELKLAALMGTALETLESIMGEDKYDNAPNRLKAALAVLAMGREKGRPTGPTTPAEVTEAQAEEKRAAASRRALDSLLHY